MIDNLVREVQNNLENGNCYSALAVSLAIPDICGKAEYPKIKKTESRYVKWFDKHIGNSEKLGNNLGGQCINYPYMSGKIIYDLRCKFLHSGSIDVDMVKNSLSSFTLIFENDNGESLYGGKSSIIQDGEEDEKRIIEISIRDLCNKICWVSKKYYEENKEKFDFIQYKIEIK